MVMALNSKFLLERLLAHLMKKETAGKARRKRAIRWAIRGRNVLKRVEKLISELAHGYLWLVLSRTNGEGPQSSLLHEKPGELPDRW